MADATVRRVAGGEVGVLRGTEAGEDFVSPSPIVLWSKAGPAAIVTFREEHDAAGDKATQRLAPVEGSGASFPITAGYTPSAPPAGRPALDLGHLHALDVDGDGVDELVVVREAGRIELHSLQKAAVTHDLPALAEGAWHCRGSHRAWAGGRDLLYLVFSRDEGGPGDRSIVVRVDGSGIGRLALGASVPPDASVVAVGALSRRGEAVEELLVLASRGGKTYLSRHRPDGAPLDTARPLYLPFAEAQPVELSFLPRTGTAVVLHHAAGQALFIDADKPANWLHAVDVASFPGEGERRMLRAVDAAAPKVLVRAGATVHALDAAGRHHGWSGGFTAARGPEPLLRLQPPAGLGLVGVYAAEGQGPELLVVHSAPHHLQMPPFAETLAAAERFLAPSLLARRKAALEPSLTAEDGYRDLLLEREQKEKGIERRPATVEEWKKLLPASFAAVTQGQQDSFVLQVMGDMQEVLEPGARLRRFQQPEELKAWLASRDRPAETVLELYRLGARVAAGKVAGYLDGATVSRIVRPDVAFRTRGGEITAVLALKPTGESRTELATLAVVGLREAR